MYEGDNMAGLKSYTCSKCAGVLVFDSDQEFFECPFCGTGFEALDFHGEEVMEQAKELLKAKSYNAAKEKYLSILINEPDNFEANLGSVLSDMRITTVEKLENPDSLPAYNVVRVKKALVNAKNNSDKNTSMYFEKLMEMVDIREEVARLRKEQQAIRSEATKQKVDAKMVADNRTERSNGMADWLPKVFYGTYIICTFAMLFFMNTSPDNEGRWASLLLMIPAALVGLIHLCVKLFTNALDRDYKPAMHMDHSLDRQIRFKLYDYSDAYHKLGSLYPSTERIKKIRANEAAAATKTPVDYTSIDPSEIVICSKCAAKLTLNKEKRVYQCDHCGVAYGVSLFFGLPMEKALNSLNTGLYSDANQRFDSILMAHPSDFEALLGRALCAGCWTKISDIDLTDDVDKESIKAVRRRLAEAKQHASVHNVPFFENVEKLIDYYDEYKANKTEIDKIDNEVKDFEADTAVMNEAFHGKDFRTKAEAQRSTLVSKAYPYQVKNKKIEVDFKDLRRSITEMRDDSVLCK